MALEVKKQLTESSQALVRRFTRGIQQSGILFRVRRRQFHRRPKSPQAQKKAALRREQARKEYEKLKKLGKMEKKERGRGRR